MKAVNLEKLLPQDIPAGERILWHGRPRWVGLARRAYRGDFVAAYFLALTAWNVVSAARDSGLSAAAFAAAKTLGVGAAALTLIALLSFALRSHHALCADLAPPGAEGRRGAADLHQSAVQTDRLRRGARLQRRNRRHSGRTLHEPARRLFRPVAACATFPFRPPPAFAALDRQCGPRGRHAEPRPEGSRRPNGRRRGAEPRASSGARTPDRWRFPGGRRRED